MKKTMKRITAVLTGATMLGATVMGAMADLGNYPAPLVMDGVFDGKIVVGEVAAAEDIIGAAEIAANLQTYSKVPVAVSGGVITVEGGWDRDDQALNTEFSLPELDDRDLEGFKDQDIKWDDEDIRISETLWADTGAFKLVTSINNTDYEYFSINTYMTVDRSKVQYRYNFENDLNASEINKSDEDTFLEIEFLGKELTIVELKEDEMSFKTSASNIMNQGDAWEVDGTLIEIVAIYEGGVLIDVEGTRKALDEGDNEKIGDIEIEVENHVWIDTNHELNFVELKAGEELTKTIDIEDSMIVFGEPEDDVEAEWIWNWNIVDDNIEYIAAENNMRRIRTIERLEELDYNADRRPALAYGESLYLPNNYGAIKFEGYYDEKSNDITLGFQERRLKNSTDDTTTETDFLVIESNSDRSPFRFKDKDDNDVRADRLFIAGLHADGNITLGYEEAGDRLWYNEFKGNMTEQNITVELARDKSFTIFPANDSTLGLKFDDEVLTFVIDGAYTEFNDSDNNVLKYQDSVDLTGVEYGVKLGYGVNFENPEDMLDDGTFVLTVPHEATKGIIVVSGPGTEIYEGATGEASEPVSIGGFAILDSEAMTMIGTEPMIVVGGPNANTVAANLLGVTAFSDDVSDLFEPNKAMIKLFENENAILVAGYAAKDTRAAALALADFENNKDKFEGKDEVEVIVSGTTVSDIRAPTPKAEVEDEEEVVEEDE